MATMLCYLRNDFKKKSTLSNVFVPHKVNLHFDLGIGKGLSKDEKLKLLWLELDVIGKKFELI